MSEHDGRCDALKPDGQRCSRRAARGIWSYAWCWQHWRQRAEAGKR